MSSWVAASLRSSASAMRRNAGARAAKAMEQDEKRVALGNLTNIVGRRAVAGKAAADAKLCSANSVADVKKGYLTSFHNVNREWGSVPKLTSIQFDREISHHGSALQKENVCCPSVPNIVPTVAPHDLSPGLSDDSVSMEDDTPTCNSMESLDLECLDNADSSVAASLLRCVDDKLHISDNRDAADQEKAFNKFCENNSEGY